jgi:cyclophilin family peptidyl-prolyl cis-trans isomerase
VVFHRSIAGFVIQGGGFKGAGTGSQFTGVVTLPPVTNEPGIANVRATVSMAKLGGDPNSATSQFFVSLGDNRANLDYQNGGFTVFGRVAGNGMQVADNISNLPTATYDLFLDGSPTATSFTDFPMNDASAPASMDQTKLVKLNSVTTIPTLSYRITGNTNSAVASASIANGQLHLTGLSGGQTTITVTATDLDNLSTSQTVAVSLTDTYATWASRNSFPGGQSEAGQNPDADGWNNLQEYAFLGDPAFPNNTSLVVYPGTTGVAPAARYMTLTFPVRKATTGMTYAVEGNDGLTGAWTEVWKSTDGFTHPQVVGALVQTDRTVVTIKDTVALGALMKRFLRIRIVEN